MNQDWDDLLAIAHSVRTGASSAVLQVEKSLQAAHSNQELNIFIELLDEHALESARQLDLRIKAGEQVGKLAGVPFALKDNFMLNVGQTTAASNILKEYSSPYTATAVQRLLDEDAIVIGKTNMDAFAHGNSTENSAFGPSKNPLDPTKVPGGSSGGSAAAVAAGIVPFALGTDTGGSIRQPASFCGVVGFKPTYGLVSRYGVVAMASSTDCVGPITRSVEDTQLVTSIIMGKDEFDGTTVDSQNIDVSAKSVPKLKIGVVKELIASGLEDDVDKSYQRSIQKLIDLGHEVSEVSIPSIDLALPCYYVLVPAEISSNLSRFDGQRYGNRSVKGESLDQNIGYSRAEGFGQENKRRIIIGTYVLSSGYYEAYYKKAQKLRTRLIDEFNSVLSKVDVLVSPTSPTTAFKIGDKIEDTLQIYMADIMTVSANLVGVPAVSVPGVINGGMPVGFQIMAAQKNDGMVLGLAKQLGEKS